MKKMVFVTIAVMCMTGVLLAETNSVPSNIPPAVINQVVDSLKINEASGWGAQIAYAMKGTLSALTDGVELTTEQIYKFSESKLGKITVAVIVYNIIGKEIIRFLIGIPLLIFLCWGIKRWFRYYLGITTDKDGEKHGVFHDMYHDSSDGGVGPIIILVGSGVASFFCVLFLLVWMF